MKMLRTAALVVGTALVCGGCSTNYGPTPPSDYHGVAITAASGTASPPATPSAAVENGIQLPGSPQEDLAQKMADSLAWQIGQWEPVSPDCDAKLVFTGATTTLDCNARWDGVSVPFEVTIGGDADPFFTLQAAQLKGLIVATEVRRAWGERYIEDAFATASEGNSLTCDSSIPKVAVVELSAPTPYRCAVAGLVYHAEISVAADSPTGGYQVIFTSTRP